MLAAVTVGSAACSGPLGGEGVLTDAGWVSDGRVVAVTMILDHPDRLWLGAAGKRFRPLPFEYCRPEVILSVFPVSGGRVGLTAVCGEPDGGSVAGAVRLVALEPSTGRVEQLAVVGVDPAEARVSIDAGVWSGAAGAAFVEYGSDCQGIGRLGGDGAVRPLELTVPLPGGSVPLGSDLPPPGGSGCAAHALARRPAISADGGTLAFFARRCDGWCTGMPEFNGEWFVVVHDLVRQTVRVLPGGFSSPYAVALSDGGVVAVSAKRDGKAAVWLCSMDPDAGCRTPKRLAEGTFFAAQFRADGNRLVTVQRGKREPAQVVVG